MTANHFGSVLLEYLDEHCHGLKCWSRTSTRDENEITAKGSNVYFSLSTNAPCHQSHNLSCRLFHIGRGCACHTGYEITRSSGKLTFNALALAAPRTLSCVLCPSVRPSRAMRMIELVRMGVAGQTEGEKYGGVDHRSGLRPQGVCWLADHGDLVGKKAERRPVCWVT